MRIEYQDQDGLLPEHNNIAPIVYDHVLLTIPARERLEAAGATVARLDGEPLPALPTMPMSRVAYRVTLGPTMPAGLVACCIPDHCGDAVRTEDEPEWPIEHDDMWARVRWTPCPQCGAALVWYEAGFAPGYRVCAHPPHHHCLVR